MTNYENDIMDFLDGETPKQKYDNLVKIKSKLESVRGFLKTLAASDDKCTIGDIRSVIEAYNKTT